MVEETRRILVVGAGVAGSACAGELRARGFDVTHVDKGRNPGGRLATRLTTQSDGSSSVFEVDHGCPSFAVESAPIRRLVDEWIHWGNAGAWSPITREADKIGAQPPGLIGLPRMNSLAVALSGSRPTLETEIEELERDAELWFARDAEGERRGPFDAAVVAVPAPQAQRLLSPVRALVEDAKSATMLPVWSLLLGFETPPPVAFQRWFAPAEGVSVIIDNTCKAGRQERSPVSAWVLHATHAWSQRHLELRPEEVESSLLPRALRLLKASKSPLCYAKAHRWRYARVEKPCSSEGYLWDAETKLGGCGDWCLGDGVEAAITSGRRLARRIA